MVRVGRDPLVCNPPAPAQNRSSLEHSTQPQFCSHCDYLKGWRLHSPSGQLLPNFTLLNISPYTKPNIFICGCILLHVLPSCILKETLASPSYLDFHAGYSTKLSLCLLQPEQRQVPDLMQPLGLVWESNAKHFGMCWTEWRNHLPWAPGHALAMAAQEPFSVVCCKVLLAHGSFFTGEPVSSTTWHSRHCSSLYWSMGFTHARYWALHFIFVEFH